MTWTAIATIAGIATAVGGCIDWWMLDDEKNRLYNALDRWWYTLDNTKGLELHRLMAERTLKFAKQVFRWKFWSWQNFVMCIAISWVMTSAAGVLGLYGGRVCERDGGSAECVTIGHSGRNSTGW